MTASFVQGPESNMALSKQFTNFKDHDPKLAVEKKGLEGLKKRFWKVSIKKLFLSIFNCQHVCIFNISMYLLSEHEFM